MKKFTAWGGRAQTRDSTFYNQASEFIITVNIDLCHQYGISVVKA